MIKNKIVDWWKKIKNKIVDWWKFFKLLKYAERYTSFLEKCISLLIFLSFPTRIKLSLRQRAVHTPLHFQCLSESLAYN